MCINNQEKGIRCCERIEVSEKDIIEKHLSQLVEKCKSNGRYMEKFNLDGEILSGKQLILHGEGYEDAYAVISLDKKIALVECKKNTYNESYWIFDDGNTVTYSHNGEYCYKAFGENNIAYLKTQKDWRYRIQSIKMENFLKDFFMFHEVERLMKKILAK